MLNQTIMQLKIELANAEKQKYECEVRVKRCFLQLSTLVNPYYSHPNEINAEEIEQTGDDLLKLKYELIKLTNKIKDIETQLGV